MGTGNSAVSQPQVPRVRVQFRNSGPEAVPQPVTVVSRVFAVLSVHCQPKSRSVIVTIYTIIIILTSFLFTNIGVPLPPPLSPPLCFGVIPPPNEISVTRVPRHHLGRHVTIRHLRSQPHLIEGTVTGLILMVAAKITW